MTHDSEVVSGCKSRGTAADDSHLFACGSLDLGSIAVGLQVHIRRERLELSDVDRLLNVLSAAGFLTGVRANSADRGGERYLVFDKFFTYVNSKNGSITKDTGITRAQLVKLTQDDDLEEDFGYFFSQINKVFNVLDDNSNSVLSADEIKAFIKAYPDLIDSMIDIQTGTIANDSDLANSVEREYQQRIEAYAAKIQAKFSAMTLDQKKAFVIARTEEYFNAAGMTDQANALARLKAANKIAYDDLNKDSSGSGTTLGVYLYYMNSAGTSWYSDDDEGDGMGGMFLDVNMAKNSSTKWYDLVEVMVHEVTHATAYLYPTNLPKWGEHVAYQAGEDYLDSVSEGAWWGFKELDEIREHIATYYSQEDVNLEPSWKWWTYQA